MSLLSLKQIWLIKFLQNCKDNIKFEKQLNICHLTPKEAAQISWTSATNGQMAVNRDNGGKIGNKNKLFNKLHQIDILIQICYL